MIRPDRRSGASWRATVVGCVLVCLVAACTSGEGDVAEDTTTSTIPPAQTLLRVGVEDWPECLNPLTCDSAVLRQQILQHVLPSAFELTPDGDYAPSALLAGEPEVETGDDGMRITYRLDPDARWDDGRPVTSSDLRATWQATMATPAAEKEGYELITEVDDRDPAVAVVSLSAPYAEWRQLFGGGRDWILKGDELGRQLDLTDRFVDELPFAAAPYRLAAWDQERAVLTAVEEHWGSEPPEVDQVRLTRVVVDELVSPQTFDLLVPAGGAAGNPPAGFEVRQLPTTTVVGIWFDQRSPLLGELLHRQAIATLVDRGAAVDLVTELDRDPIDCLGWLPGVGPWCEAAAVELPEQDPGVAAFALATAGWVPGPDGVLTRGGVRFVVPLTHDPAVPGATEVVDALAEDLAAIGIATDRTPMAASTWAEPRPPDRSTGIGVFPVDLGVSPQVQGYTCAGGLEASRILWCPADVVASARALERTVDVDAQLALVESIGTAAGADVVWLPLAQRGTVSYVQTDLVSVPDDVSVIGGALARLTAFGMDE